jgi:hypothetical protein
MKKFTPAAVTATALLVPAFVLAPAAHADEISYLADLNSHGIYPADGNYRTTLLNGVDPGSCVGGGRGEASDRSRI